MASIFSLFGEILIDNTNADKSIDKTTEKAEGGGSKVGKAFAAIGKGAVAMGKAIVTGTAAIATALVATAENTREYRGEMAKLETAFTTSGHSATAAKNTYTSLYSVLGETDQAVEASNHLAKLCQTEEDLSSWTDICTGVYATFGDSLPIEGLTEAANETAKVGQITGSLADALNWAGVSEDEFNEKLAQCSTEQERQQLIQTTLTGLYKEASNTYKELNGDILSANEAQAKLTDATAKIGAVDGYSGTTTIKTLGGSVISSVSTLTADNATAKLTLSVTVYNTSYTHTLVIKNGSTSILTISSLKLANGSNTITLTAAQRSTILKAMSKIKSFTGTFELKTFSGSAQIGNASSKTATIQTTAANSAPTFSGFTYEDSNATSAGVTENNQILIQGISTLKITAQTATAKNEASISSYSVVAGNATASSITTTINAGKITTTGSVPVIVTAIDTRGYTTSATVNITVLKYTNIDISSCAMRRINEVEDATQVSINGSITPVTIGQLNKNGLQYLRYRYKKTSDEEYSNYYDLTNLTMHNDNSFNFESHEWLSIDADYSYYVQFTVADKLTADTVTVTIPQGTPLLSFRRKKIGVNKREPAAALDVDGSVMMNGFNVLGLVAALTDSEDLNNLVEGGIYTQAQNANANTDRHYPKAIAGFLEVIVNPSGYILQRYTAYNNSAVYIRTRYNNTWYAWKSVTLTTI